MSEKILVPKGGRPPGAKTENTPASIRRAFAGKTRYKMHELLDKNDKDAILTMAKLLFKDLPPSAVSLHKVKTADDAVKALAQLINLTAAGMIPGDQADRLERQIARYLELTELAQLKERLEALEENRKDEQV